MVKAPTPVKRYHETLIQTMRDIGQHQKWFTSPINLGGVTGPGGGSGIPIGGLIGQLIQSKVAYDTTEASTLFTPASGASLVDNLNHIRYWIDTVSGIISGSGTMVAVSDNDTAPGYLEDKLTAGSSKITVTTFNDGGDEERQVDLGTVNLDDLNGVVITSVVNGEILGYSGGWLNRTLSEAAIASAVHTHLEIDITNLDHNAVKIQGTDVSVVSPSGGDVLVYSAGGEYVPSGISVGIDIQEEDTPKVTDATILNFEGGVTVTDESGGKATVTISGLAGIDIEEAGTPKVTDATILNFVAGATIVDVGGGQADITISGGGGNGGGDFSVWMPEASPASPSACDDEFDDSSFDTGLWTEFDVSGHQTYGEDDVGFVFSQTTNGTVTGIVQPPTSEDDWTIQTRISCTNYATGGAGCVGLLLLATLDPIQFSNVVLFGIYTGTNGNGFEVWTFDDYAKSNPTTPYTDQSKYHPAVAWLRIEANSGVWRFWTSDDGITWYLRYSVSRDFIPEGIGIGGFLGNTAGAETRTEFFRYQTDLSYGAPVLGDRVDIWRA